MTAVQLRNERLHVCSISCWQSTFYCWQLPHSSQYTLPHTQHWNSGSKSSEPDDEDKPPFGTLLGLHQPNCDNHQKTSSWAQKTIVVDRLELREIDKADAELDFRVRLLLDQYSMFPTATKCRKLRTQRMPQSSCNNDKQVRKGRVLLEPNIFEKGQQKGLLKVPSNNRQDCVEQITLDCPTRVEINKSKCKRLSSKLFPYSLRHRQNSEVSSTSQSMAFLKPPGPGRTSTTDSVDVNGCSSWPILGTGPDTIPGHYKRQPVAVHRIHLRYAQINRDVKKSFKLLHDVKHNNLAAFLGACVEPDRVCVLWEFAARGSLRDIVRPGQAPLKSMFLTSLTFDIIRGLTYLHDSDLCYHGNLKSTNCIVDSRWVLKLTDFGLTAFRSGKPTHCS